MAAFSSSSFVTIVLMLLSLMIFAFAASATNGHEESPDTKRKNHHHHHHHHHGNHHGHHKNKKNATSAPTTEDDKDLVRISASDSCGNGKYDGINLEKLSPVEFVADTVWNKNDPYDPTVRQKKYAYMISLCKPIAYVPGWLPKNESCGGTAYAMRYKMHDSIHHNPCKGAFAWTPEITYHKKKKELKVLMADNPKYESFYLTVVCDKNGSDKMKAVSNVSWTPWSLEDQNTRLELTMASKEICKGH